MLKVIEGLNTWSQFRPGELIPVTRICTYDRSISLEGEEVYECIERIQTSERFWDVVGDSVMENVCSAVKGNQSQGMCCLIPAVYQQEGLYYSRSVLREILQSMNAGWQYLLFDGYETEPDCGIKSYCTLNWKDTLRKEYKRNMDKKQLLSSLEEYRGASANPPAATSSPSYAQYLSPLSSGNTAAISRSTRNKIMEFAHSVDAAIIRSLDNPAINGVFNKVVQTSIDASYGLSLATGIHVSRNTYPELYAIVEECAAKLNIPVPYVIISDQVRGINACTAGTDQFAFIAISSMLPVVLNADELKFVIGHECGHLALGHVVYHTALGMMCAAGGLLPMVGNIIAKTISYPLNAWSRRSEISADRAGLICCNDVQVAKRSLFKLEAGFLNISSVDIDAYVRESEAMLENSTLGRLNEFFMSHPIIPKRIKAIDLFGRSVAYAKAMGIDPKQIPGAISLHELTQQTEKIIEVM